jgi:hypothetical protein
MVHIPLPLDSVKHSPCGQIDWVWKLFRFCSCLLVLPIQHPLRSLGTAPLILLGDPSLGQWFRWPPIKAPELAV